jgi:hypothetical protein
MPNAAVRQGLLDEYMPVWELAAELNVHPQTLRRWHAERRGPPRTKIARTFYYRRGAVEEWLRSREQSNMTPAPARHPGRPRSPSPPLTA